MYPLSILDRKSVVAPLFGSALRGPPHIFDFSSGNPQVMQYDPAHFPEFQRKVYEVLRESGMTWGIGRYFEERRTMLRHFPQMIQEERIYHVGVDITSLPGTPLFAPLDAEVFAAGKEEGAGNYGGFVILRHDKDEDIFYSFYGHLQSHHTVREGQRIVAGEKFAVIGDGEDSGGWFTHTHLQIITEEAQRQGRMFHGYLGAGDLPHLEKLFPSPYPLFRY
ncbi:MAG: peptidoglycan DD-metalloendopeptidase family protein [Patescibacteria group bacterium]